MAGRAAGSTRSLSRPARSTPASLGDRFPRCSVGVGDGRRRRERRARRSRVLSFCGSRGRALVRLMSWMCSLARVRLRAASPWRGDVHEACVLDSYRMTGRCRVAKASLLRRSLTPAVGCVCRTRLLFVVIRSASDSAQAGREGAALVERHEAAAAGVRHGGRALVDERTLLIAARGPLVISHVIGLGRHRHR